MIQEHFCSDGQKHLESTWTIKHINIKNKKNVFQGWSRFKSCSPGEEGDCTSTAQWNYGMSVQYSHFPWCSLSTAIRGAHGGSGGSDEPFWLNPESLRQFYGGDSFRLLGAKTGQNSHGLRGKEEHK